MQLRHCGFALIYAILLAVSNGPAVFADTDSAQRTIDASKFPTLQAALDEVPVSGGIVRIPPGTYELKEPLVVKTGDTRLEGSGAATHLLNRNEAGKPAILIAPAKLDTDPKAELWRIQVANLRISGNPKSGDGIHARKVQEILVQAVAIDHNGGNGIHLDNCYEDPRINDNILTYNAQAGLLITVGHDIVVSGNQFEENQDAIRCIDSFNLCATGNAIDDHLRHGIVIEDTYGSVVSGNMIEECNGTALILDRDCYGITLSSNVIAHHLGGGIDLKDANGCSVSANTFVLCHSFSVRVGPESGRNAITGNVFANTYIGSGKLKRPIREHKNPLQIDTGSGIILESARDVAITGNTFTGLDTAAVKASGCCTKILVSNNILTDCARSLPEGASWIDLGDALESLRKDNLGSR
jgi:parallel beta-helix repeat protein